jgi:hypothetical protein
LRPPSLALFGQAAMSDLRVQCAQERTLAGACAAAVIVISGPLLRRRCTRSANHMPTQVEAWRRDFASTGKSPIRLSSPSYKKISIPIRPKSPLHRQLSRTRQGAYRDRHGRWARDVMDAGARLTSARDADGEAAWSWHPDAGVKLAMMLRITPMTVARKPGHRGERRKSR